MLTDSTFDFLAQLSQNNNKEWFTEHQNDYEKAKDQIIKLTNQILPLAAGIEPALSGQTAKDCMYRIYRDLRFSKDKTPYKDHIGVYVCAYGKKTMQAGYYLHIADANNCFVGGGSYLLNTAMLAAIRQEIDYHTDEFLQIVTNPDFLNYFGKIQGESLKTKPKKYDYTHPAFDYLVKKNLWASSPISSAELKSKDAAEHVAKRFKLLKPLNDFLNRATDDICMLPSQLRQ